MESPLNSLEAVVKATFIANGTARAVGAQLAGLLMANAMYSAYAFYQARKREPLTPEEMEEIHSGVLDEIGKYSKMYADALTSDDGGEE